MQGKIRKVNDLAKHQVDSIAWWVIFRTDKVAEPLQSEDHWMIERIRKDDYAYHPKSLYQRGPLRSFWKANVRLPHLYHSDFAVVTSMLTSTVVIEEFVIQEITRSQDTGEFFYSNKDGEWMPESYLFDTKTAANKERLRIMKLVKKWADSNSQ